MPLSDVALPPAGIRFIWLGAEVAGGAGVFALGGAVEGAGCARTGAQIARAAAAAMPINIRFMCKSPYHFFALDTGTLVTLTQNRECRNAIRCGPWLQLWRANKKAPIVIRFSISLLRLSEPIPVAPVLQRMGQN
jgi:hypothetical protein